MSLRPTFHTKDLLTTPCSEDFKYKKIIHCMHPLVLWWRPEIVTKGKLFRTNEDLLK